MTLVSYKDICIPFCTLFSSLFLSLIGLGVIL
jgi:hypothetical protein